MSTVLLIEDDRDNRMIYRTILEHSGYSVIEAADGEVGVQMARNHRPAVVLMDITIPKLDGWAATRILKADPETSDIPIIAITARALAKDRTKAVEAGCDSYLPKPVEPRRVVEEVQRFIGPAATPPVS